MRAGGENLTKFTLTPDLLRSTYNMLCEVAPFDKWNLPDGEDINFKVTRDKKYMGWWLYKEGKRTIGISKINVTRLDTMIQVMMHEMVHVHEENVHVSRKDVMHSEAWKRWADEVCQIHHIAPDSFMHGEVETEDANS